MKTFDEKQQDGESVGAYARRMKQRMTLLEEEIEQLKDSVPMNWERLEKLVLERKSIPTLVWQASREQFQPWVKACLDGGNGDVYDVDAEHLATCVRELIVDVTYQMVQRGVKTREDVEQALLFVHVSDPE